MNSAKRFIQKFAVSIVSLLSCFERVIFRGYLPFHGEQYLNDYVDRVLRMRRKDFLPWLKQHSERLVQHGKKIAREQGRPYEHRQGRFKKEKFIQELIRQDALDLGLVASWNWMILSVPRNWRIGSPSSPGSNSSMPGRGRSIRC
jgi:hypothetical protein